MKGKKGTHFVFLTKEVHGRKISTSTCIIVFSSVETELNSLYFQPQFNENSCGKLVREKKMKEKKIMKKNYIPTASDL